jgi:tRNA 2-thiocytidine biosynthesis protein TtcA
VAEEDCNRFATAMGYPIIPCDLCGSQDGLQRQVIKRMLDDWEVKAPGRRQKLFSALTNVRGRRTCSTRRCSISPLSRAVYPIRRINRPAIKRMSALCR